jgi:glycosyltransferase 2 family protein
MSLSGNEPRARTRATLLLRGCGLIAALAFLARGVKWQEVTLALRRAGLGLPLVVVVLNAGMMSLRALRLRLLLGKKLSFASSFSALLTSSALNNVTPFRGGHLARLWMIERASGVSKSAALAISLVENLVELSVLAVLAFCASWITTGQRWATVATPVLFAASAGALFMLRTMPWGRSGTDAKGPRGALRRFLVQAQPGFAALSKPGVLPGALLLSFLAWLFEAVMILVCARSMALTLSFPSTILVLLGINLALALPSTPASAGPFEGATVAVLMLAGIAKEPSLAFALFYHALQVLPVTVAGVVVLLATRRDRTEVDSSAERALGWRGRF